MYFIGPLNHLISAALPLSFGYPDFRMNIDSLVKYRNCTGTGCWEYQWSLTHRTGVLTVGMVAKPYNCTHIGFYHKSFATLCINVFLQSKLLMWFCWYLFWNMWWPWHLESNCGRTWNPEMWCVEQPWEETCEILRNTHLDTLIQLFREPLWETLSHFIERPWETSWNPVRDLEKPCEILSETLRKRERPWETLWETMRDLERPWETLRDLERPWETWVTLKEPGLSFIFCVFMQHSADTIWFPLIPILPQKYHTQSCHSNRILSSHISLRLAELPSLSHSRFWESPTQGIYMIVVTRHGVDLSKNRVYKISQGVYGGNLSRYGVNLWMFLGIIFRFDISLKVWSGSLKVFGKHFTEYVAFLSRCPIHALKVWCISQPIELILSRFPISLKVWGIAEHMIHLPGLEKTMSGLRRFSHGVLNNMIAWLTQTVNRLNKEPRVWWTKSCVNSKLFQSFVSCSCFKYQT